MTNGFVTLFSDKGKLFFGFLHFPLVGVAAGISVRRGLRAPGDDQHFRGLGRAVSVGGDLARRGGGVPGGDSHWKISVTRGLSPSFGVEILSAWVSLPVSSCLFLLGGVYSVGCVFITSPWGVSDLTGSSSAGRW